MFRLLAVGCILLQLVYCQYEGPQMNVINSGYETVPDDQDGEDPVSATGGDQLGYQGDLDQPVQPLVDPPNLTPPPTPPPHWQNSPQASLLNPGIQFPPQASQDNPRAYIDSPRVSPRLPTNTRPQQPRKPAPNTRPRTDQPIPKPPLLEGIAPRPLVDPVNLGPPNVPIPRPSRTRPSTAPRVYVDPVNLGPPNVPIPTPGGRVNTQYGSNQPLVDPLRNRPLPLPEPPRLQVPPECANYQPVPPGADDSGPSNNVNYDLDYPPGVNGGSRNLRVARALEALSTLQTQLFNTFAGLKRSAKDHANNEFSAEEVKALTDSVLSATNVMKKMRRKHRF